MISKEIAKSQGLRAKKANNNDNSYKNGLLLLVSLASLLCFLNSTKSLGFYLRNPSLPTQPMCFQGRWPMTWLVFKPTITFHLPMHNFWFQSRLVVWATEYQDICWNAGAESFCLNVDEGTCTFWSCRQPSCDHESCWLEDKAGDAEGRLERWKEAGPLVTKDLNNP